MLRPVHLVPALLIAVLATTAWAADQSKSGKIKSVDAKAKTFVLAVTNGRDLTLTVNDKTTITLDGKDSTFDAAVKTDQPATVSYEKSGDTRTAAKVQVTTPTTPAK